MGDLNCSECECIVSRLFLPLEPRNKVWMSALRENLRFSRLLGSCRGVQLLGRLPVDRYGSRLTRYDHVEGVLD